MSSGETGAQLVNCWRGGAESGTGSRQQGGTAMAVKITHRAIGQQLRFPNRATANQYLKVIDSDAENWEVTLISGEPTATIPDQRDAPPV
jgi:hypothetical protein